MVTALDKRIPLGKVREFVENVEAVGLSINKWRTERGWAQQEIEAMLDHLEAIQLLFPRRSGVAAKWRRVVSKEKLARMLGVVLLPCLSFE